LAAVNINVPVAENGKVARGFQFTCIACALKARPV
jgi:hypothetical protein